MGQMNRQILFDGHLMDDPFLMREDGINCRNNNELSSRGLFDGCLTEGGVLSWIKAEMGPRKTRNDTKRNALFRESRAFRGQKRGLA